MNSIKILKVVLRCADCKSFVTVKLEDPTTEIIRQAAIRHKRCGHCFSDKIRYIGETVDEYTKKR